jgi:hypothetical protein
MTIGVHRRWSAVALVLLAACAELRWHKDGADAATLDGDLVECRLQARAQARRHIPVLAPDTPRVVGADARGQPIMGTSRQLDADRTLLEHDLMRDCMRGKGYELVPAETR